MKRIILGCAAAILGSTFIGAQQTVEEAIMSENEGRIILYKHTNETDEATEVAEVKEVKKEVNEEKDEKKAKKEKARRAIEDDDENDLKSPSRTLLLGVTAGANMTTYLGDRNSQMGLGGQIGINCDVPVNDNFSIMPELIFAYRTVGVDNITWDNKNDLVKMESTDKLIYMLVPINVKWSTEAGPGRPFIAAGPMISVGLFGKNTVNDSKVDAERGDMLLFQSDPNSYYIEHREEPPYNNLDLLANVKAGYDFDFGLSVSLGFQYGIFNMYKMTDERELRHKESGLDTSQNSMTFSFSLGYNF